MEKPNCPVVKDWSHWEKFELERCTYSVTVNDTKLNATVLMLNPSSSVLVKWSIAACGIKLGLSDKIAVTECAEEILNWILCQSNGQFPVAGIVIEQGRAYSFRDGLSVKLKWSPKSNFTQPLTKQYQAAALDPNHAVVDYGEYARIAGTQLKWYQNFETQYLHRTPIATTKSQFASVVRDLYQDAWKRANDPTSPETIGKYRNDLIIAYQFR